VDDALDVRVLVEDGLGVVEVAKVDPVVHDLPARQLVDPVEHALGGSAVVVDGDDFVAVPHQVEDGMAADVAAASGDEYLLHAFGWFRIR